MPYRQFQNLEEVAEYAQGLDERWPEREAVAGHISGQLAGLSSRFSAQVSAPFLQVVELCTGPGRLAARLLADHSHLFLTGFDISGPALAFARARLAPYRGRFRLIQADLNQDGWLDQLPPVVHAVVSMQSLHDLGDECCVDRIYGLARRILTPGGLFINADLLAASPPDPKNPGRLSVQRHLALLRQHGFAPVACTLQTGGFGCFVASVPEDRRPSSH